MVRPTLGPVSTNPGQQFTPRGVNFASMYGLTPVSVDMSISLSAGNFARLVTRSSSPGNPPCRRQNLP